MDTALTTATMLRTPLLEAVIGARIERATPQAHDYERIFREDGPGLFRTIYAFTGGRKQMTEDVVAEAFARAISSGDVVKDPIPWLYRVSFRLAQVELKKERRRQSEYAGPGAGPEPGLEGVVGALKQLSPHQRAAIVMHYEADLPIEDVARRMGMAAPTVRVHIHRGRKRLREILGAEEVTV